MSANQFMCEFLAPFGMLACFAAGLFAGFINGRHVGRYEAGRTVDKAQKEEQGEAEGKQQIEAKINWVP